MITLLVCALALASPRPEPLPDSVTLARLHRQGGRDWDANPSSLPNLPAERAALRWHLDAGGFLHADDNYGLDASFREEMAQVFPGDPLTEIPPDHPVFRVMYDLPEGLRKIHEHDAKRPQAFGIFRRGRGAGSPGPSGS